MSETVGELGTVGAGHHEDRLALLLACLQRGKGLSATSQAACSLFALGSLSVTGSYTTVVPCHSLHAPGNLVRASALLACHACYAEELSVSVPERTVGVAALTPGGDRARGHCLGRDIDVICAVGRRA